LGGREIAQEGGEILPKIFSKSLGKILRKFCEFKISPKTRLNTINESFNNRAK